MPNYYEMLKIEPNASSAEIEAALDELYNQWLPQVTHHVRERQLQAQQELQKIERVRGTLSDPTRRADYDAGIGIGGIGVGGLADPNALLQSLQAGPGTPLPPPPPGGSAAASVRAPTGLWACPNCHADNQPNTRFCLKCGRQLVRACPECKGETSLVATGMCSNCGYHIDAATRRQEIRKQLDNLKIRVAEAEPKHAEAVANATGVGWGGVGAVVGAILVVVGGSTPGGGVVAPIGLIILACSIVGIIARNAAKSRWKTEAMNTAEVLEKIQDQIKRLQTELGSPQLNRS